MITLPGTGHVTNIRGLNTSATCRVVLCFLVLIVAAHFPAFAAGASGDMNPSRRHPCAWPRDSLTTGSPMESFRGMTARPRSGSMSLAAAEGKIWPGVNNGALWQSRILCPFQRQTSPRSCSARDSRRESPVRTAHRLPNITAAALGIPGISRMNRTSATARPSGGAPAPRSTPATAPSGVQNGIAIASARRYAPATPGSAPMPAAPIRWRATILIPVCV